MVSRVELGKNGRVTGVHYFDRDGNSHFQSAKAVIIAGYSIETPRLLLNSACPGFENGLANSSGTVGRYLMAQAGNVVLGRFDQPVRMYKAPPAHALTEEFYETDPKNDFARGFAIQTVGPLPDRLRQADDRRQESLGLGPAPRNDGLQPLGRLRSARRNPSLGGQPRHPRRRERPLRPAGRARHLQPARQRQEADQGRKEKTMEVMRAAGATEVVQEARYAHLVGAARMGADPRTSVVDKFGRTHDIANLFVCDGSILPTQGSANPGPHHSGARGAHRRLSDLAGRCDLLERQARHDRAAASRQLAPPGTYGKGVPRLQG